MRRTDLRASPILTCSLCCTNTIGAVIHAPLIGEVQRINKNPRKQLICAANAPLFPLRGGERARFAYKGRAQCSAINMSCAVYIEPILLALRRSYCLAYFFRTRKKNIVKPRWNLNKTTKECPAPQSKAPALLLTPFSTHLSFRWTLSLITPGIL